VLLGQVACVSLPAEIGVEGEPVGSVQGLESAAIVKRVGLGRGPDNAPMGGGKSAGTVQVRFRGFLG
jgi:hypothetical protein